MLHLNLSLVIALKTTRKGFLCCHANHGTKYIGELKSVLFAAATQLCTVVIVIMCNQLIPA